MSVTLTKKPIKLGSPKRTAKCKKVSKLLHAELETKVSIPSVNAFSQNDAINLDDVDETVLEYDAELEEELLKYHYQPINTILLKDNAGNIINKYIKAINKMGQKVYIQIDDYQKKNFDTDLTLVETKQGSILPYSVKNGAMKLAGMDVSGLAFECNNNDICLLENDIADEDITVVESNFTLTEERCASAIVENYGCHMSYPVVKLSEIRVNNQLVMDGANCVTRKLRNASFKAYSDDMHCTQESIACLHKSYDALFDLFERDAVKLTETLTTLEKYNAYYIENPPLEECDIKKANVIVHNMRIRNDYIANLICAMKRVSEYKAQIDQLTNNLLEFKEYFEEQYASLDEAKNI